MTFGGNDNGIKSKKKKKKPLKAEDIFAIAAATDVVVAVPSPSLVADDKSCQDDTTVETMNVVTTMKRHLRSYHHNQHEPYHRYCQ